MEGSTEYFGRAFFDNISIMEISERGKNQVDSPIRSLSPFADQAKVEGVEVLHLNIGQPDIPTPPNAIKHLQESIDGIIAYGSSEGNLSLRKVASEYYQSKGLPISSDDIFVTTGASEAIHFALLSCTDLGDEIIIPEPFYANYLGYAQMAGINIKAITASIKSEFALPKPEMFEQLINSKTKAIFLCNPGNPTGQLYSKHDLKELAQLVKKHDLYLIVDEVYREFCYEEDFTSVLSLEEIDQQVIVLDSISKVFSSCGARIGYLITKNKKLQTAIMKYAQLRLSPPALGQVLAEACYKNRATYLKEVIAAYKSRRNILFERLSNIEGIRCYKPKAAFYNIVELPVEDAAAFCKWMLTDFRHNGKTVMFSPANGFYYNKELGKKQIRIAFILNEEKLNQTMDCLERGLALYREMEMAVVTNG
jgi:aspartate aminotransferase